MVDKAEDERRPQRVAVLGASSLVWRLTAPFWDSLSQPDFQTVPIYRTGNTVAASDLRTHPQKCDIVFAVWGVTGQDPERLKLNPILARQAVELAHAWEARRLIYFSSGAVYGSSDRLHSETDLPSCPNSYGQSKLLSEDVLSSFRGEAISLRIGNVAGADALFRSLAQSDHVTLTADQHGRTPSRSYIAPDDLAELLHGLSKKTPIQSCKVLNVAGPTAVDMASVVSNLDVPVTLSQRENQFVPRHELCVEALKGIGLAFPSSSDPFHLARFSHSNAAGL